jgi:hypothetical protein
LKELLVGIVAGAAWVRTWRPNQLYQRLAIAFPNCTLQSEALPVDKKDLIAF